MRRRKKTNLSYCECDFVCPSYHHHWHCQKCLLVFDKGNSDHLLKTGWGRDPEREEEEGEKEDEEDEDEENEEEAEEEEDEAISASERENEAGDWYWEDDEDDDNETGWLFFFSSSS